MASHNNQVFLRTQLLDALWGHVAYVVIIRSPSISLSTPGRRESDERKETVPSNRAQARSTLLAAASLISSCRSCHYSLPPLLIQY
ncbi:hypothetical protein ACLBWT_05620 [Paenibacillus sp. D51F]